MPVVEKNDVNIERLFAWSKEHTIITPEGKEVKVYIRLLGDADLNKARVMALRRSSELRKALKDPDSDERVAYIPYQEELSKDILVSSIVALTMRESTQQIIRELSMKVPKEPASDATTEELEKYQKEVDEYPEKREKAIRERLDKLLAKRREEYEELEEDNLYSIYLGVLIKELCEQELLKRFKEYCVFFGTYSDRKLTKRFFNDFSSFDNIPSNIKDDLTDTYSLLEIESEELKK